MCYDKTFCVVRLGLLPARVQHRIQQTPGSDDRVVSRLDYLLAYLVDWTPVGPSTSMVSFVQGNCAGGCNSFLGLDGEPWNLW
jgi:hypothetical protein